MTKELYKETASIDLPETNTVYQLTEDKGIFFQRTQILSQGYASRDTMGRVWGFGYADVPLGTMGIKTRGEILQFGGRLGLLSPPHSLIHWVFLKNACLKWAALVYFDEFLTGFPKRSCLYRLPADLNPNSKDSLREALSQSERLCYVDKAEDANPVSLKLKKYLDEDSSGIVKISKYAEDLGIHPDVMRRYFRKTYELSPLEYRNRMKLFESIWMLAKGERNVAEVAYEVGFENLKNFYSQFREYTSLAPGQMKMFNPLKGFLKE